MEPGRRSASIAGIATILALLAGCRDQDAPVPPATPPDLELVSRGAEPRTLLRYRPAVGTQRRLHVSIDLEMEAGDMGGPLPTLVMDLLVSVDALMPTGQVMLHASIENLAAREPPGSKVSAASLLPVIAPMKGIGFSAILAPDGRLTGMALDARARQLPSATQGSLGSLVDSFAQTLMPLPDVPVGPGAVWRASRPLVGNGLTLTSVSSISLTRVSGSTFDYTLESTLHGADQTATEQGGSGSAGSGGNRVDIKNTTGHGSGIGTVDLVTLAVSSQLIADLQSEMTAAGETEPTKMEMATLTKVSSLPDAPPPQGAQSAP